jgi:hypothetical protein
MSKKSKTNLLRFKRQPRSVKATVGGQEVVFRFPFAAIEAIEQDTGVSIAEALASGKFSMWLTVIWRGLQWSMPGLTRVEVAEWLEGDYLDVGLCIEELSKCFSRSPSGAAPESDPNGEAGENPVE